MEKELKPCPFCGSNRIDADEAPYRVICLDCAAEGPMGGNYIELWNKRYEDMEMKTK